jgi:hypothetical protein
MAGGQVSGLVLLASTFSIIFLLFAWVNLDYLPPDLLDFSLAQQTLPPSPHDWLILHCDSYCKGDRCTGICGSFGLPSLCESEAEEGEKVMCHFDKTR